MSKGAALFSAPGLRARELAASDLPALQAFFDANPEYWLDVNGKRPPPDLARTEFDERPPPYLPFDKNWVTGLFDDDDVLTGAAIFVSGFTAAPIWHLALFIVATRRRGSGWAWRAYTALEQWMHERGCRWLRLGVVQGNAAAERFWQRQGFVETRVREGVDTGGRLHTIRVMVKPLAGGSLDDYLALAPRDRRGSALP